jgi:beta-xylosidase
MGAGNVYHEDAAGRPFYDFTIADQVYDAVVEAGLRPLVELAFTPRALVPDGAEARFRFEPSPTQWSPYEAGLWSFPPKDYAKWAWLVRALVEHCVARYGAPHVRGMKKLLDMSSLGGVHVDQATTWSFYFEGERFFEGTRSLFTAQGVEKPVLNAYRMLARLGEVRIAAESSHAWPSGQLDRGEPGMPEEIDALATMKDRDRVTVLVWRHADDQYSTDAAETDVTLRVEHLPFGGDRVRLRHWRIDARHSNSHTAWTQEGSPQDPTEAQLRTIKARQGLELLEPEREEKIRAGTLELRTRLPLPSVSLIEIEPRA